MAQDPVVLADADNTLWDTDDVYSSAQLALLSNIEVATGKRVVGSNRLEFVREYDQAIAARHHLHLRYPSPMLIRALVAGLSSMASTEAAESVIRGRKLPYQISILEIDSIASEFALALSKMPDLLQGVQEGLQLAKDHGLVTYVLTEGQAEKQRKLIDFHGLGKLVQGVSEVTKSESQFRRLRKRFFPANVYVVGDQEDRDIIPADKARCITILIPSRFRPKWQDRDCGETAFFVANNFLEAISWIVEKEKKELCLSVNK